MASDDDDDLDTDIGGEGGEDAGDPDDGKTPEEVLEELKKTRAALARANKQAERARKTAKPGARKPAEKVQDAATDDKAAEIAETRFRAVAVRTAGAAALLEAGFQGNRKAAADLTRMLDAEDLDIDDDGEIDGLDDAVAELKERYPGLFIAPVEQDKPARRRVGKVDANAGRGVRRVNGPEASKDSAVKLGAILRGGK